jgi:primase-polymerase (primpol)-like protein
MDSLEEGLEGGSIDRYVGVPTELRAINNWCVAGTNRKDYLQHKAPQYWNGEQLVLASPTNPETWMSFDNAVAIVEHYGKSHEMHIGFVFQKELGFVCIDLDNKQGLPGRVAEFDEIIKRAGSYTELSKSGMGYHTVVKATMLDDGRRYDEKGVEMYKHNRFVIITGDVVNGERSINDNQALVDKLITVMPTKEGQASVVSLPAVLSDDEVLNRILGSQSKDKFLELADNTYALRSMAMVRLRSRMPGWL